MLHPYSPNQQQPVGDASPAAGGSHREGCSKSPGDQPPAEGRGRQSNRPHTSQVSQRLNSEQIFCDYCKALLDQHDSYKDLSPIIADLDYLVDEFKNRADSIPDEIKLVKLQIWNSQTTFSLIIGILVAIYVPLAFISVSLDVLLDLECD
jgi:hypothetical protein